MLLPVAVGLYDSSMDASSMESLDEHASVLFFSLDASRDQKGSWKIVDEDKRHKGTFL